MSAASLRPSPLILSLTKDEWHGHLFNGWFINYESEKSGSFFIQKVNTMCYCCFWKVLNNLVSSMITFFCEVVEMLMFLSSLLLHLILSWPGVTLIICFFMRKNIAGLIDRISEFKIKGLVTVICQDSSISEKAKLLLIKPLIERVLKGSMVRARLAFRCSKTKMVKDVTGDGTWFRVPFENCDLNSTNGVFTAPQTGMYSVKWNISLSGITNQKEGVVLVESSNETFRIPTNNLAMLKNNDGSIMLSGEVLVEADMLDTVKLAVKIGTDKDSKTVHLAERSDAQFYGVLL